MPKSKGKSKRRSKGNTESSFSDSPSPDRPKMKSMFRPEETFLDKLMKKADSLRDTFEYDLSAQFYKRILECEPENLRAIESVSYVYLQSGELKEAEKYLLQALRLSPERGFGKYFQLGQLSYGHEGLDYFKKGIQVLESDVLSPDMTQVSPLEGSDEGKKRDLSLAYCALVDLYMTDLCDEEDAEIQCKNYIDLAISSDETNPESYMCSASYHLVKEEQEDARSSIEKCLSLWFPEYKLSREQKTENCPLSYDVRINTSKILIEVTMYDEANEILDGLVEEDDEVLQVWYLLGVLNNLRGNDYYGNARFYFKKGLKLCEKYDLELEYEDQIKHMKELLSEMGPGSNEDEDKENKEENDDDEEDDYETVSEEEEEEMVS